MILLTPGHSPEHEGAVSADGAHECQWATRVVGLVVADSYGLDVEAWTRDAGDLGHLVERINRERPELAVDIHFDAAAVEAHGVSVLIHPAATEQTRWRASRLLVEVMSSTGLSMHGSGVVERSDLAYLSGTSCPAMVLEAGFGATSDWERMAPQAVAAGILSWLRQIRGAR